MIVLKLVTTVTVPVKYFVSLPYSFSRLEPKAGNAISGRTVSRETIVAAER